LVAGSGAKEAAGGEVKKQGVRGARDRVSLTVSGVDGGVGGGGGGGGGGWGGRGGGGGVGGGCGWGGGVVGKLGGGGWVILGTIQPEGRSKSDGRGLKNGERKALNDGRRMREGVGRESICFGHL